MTTSGLDAVSGVATTKTVHLKVGAQMLRLRECDGLEAGRQRCVLRQPLPTAIPEGAEWREAAMTEARALLLTLAIVAYVLTMAGLTMAAHFLYLHSLGARDAAMAGARYDAHRGAAV